MNARKCSIVDSRGRVDFDYHGHLINYPWYICDYSVKMNLTFNFKSKANFFIKGLDQIKVDRYYIYQNTHTHAPFALGLRRVHGYYSSKSKAWPTRTRYVIYAWNIGDHQTVVQLNKSAKRREA